MSVMGKARSEVADGLKAAGLIVKDHVPAKVVPPLVILGTGSPMLEYAGNYGQEFTYRLQVGCIVGTKPNPEAATALEEMVETVLLNLGDWDVDDVTPLEMIPLNDAYYVSCTLSISNTITIGEK